MSDDIEQFTAKGVQPFGVNPAGVDRHRAYVSQKGFPFPLLSDPGLAVATAYGAVKPNGKSIARCVVAVGRDGKVIYAQAGLPSDEEILAAL